MVEHRGPWLSTAGAVLAVVTLLTPFGPIGTAGGTASRSDGWNALRAFRAAHPELVLPDALPDDVTSAAPTLVDGQPSLAVFSLGGPGVTVCSGDADACRHALPLDEELRTGAADGVPYVVLVNPTQDALRPYDIGALRTFWTEAQFSTTTPPWLPS